MGLDQYAKSCDPSQIAGDTDFETPDGCATVFQWRKHPDLQGWMEGLYYAKGGKAKIFNCVSVRLKEEDIDALESAVLDGDLPRTEGFFFGASHADHREGDLKFIRATRAELALGRAVFYDSWW